MCCAVADFEVGVDVQKHQNVKTGLGRRFFPEEDNQILAGLMRRRERAVLPDLEHP